MTEEVKEPWYQRRWEEIRPHFIWEIIKFLFGGGLVTSFVLGVVRLFQWLANTQAQLSWIWLTIIFILSSVGFVVGSLCLRSLRDSGFKNRLSTGAVSAKKMTIIYVPIILGLAFCAWAYFVASRVYRLSDEVRHLQTQARRYLLPRELTQQESAALASYLSKYGPPSLVMNIVKDDDEAGSYGGDIQTALAKAGWNIATINYPDTLPEGLRVDVNGPGPDLPAVMREAFRTAQIELNGAGGGGSSVGKI